MKAFDVYPLYPLNIVRGLGAKVFDDEDNEYLDFYGGHAVISIGHSHPHYIKAITEQIHKIGFYSNSVQNRLQERLANLLGLTSGYDDYQLFLINSGAEANENALKLASFHTGKSKIISFKKGFHGRTSAAVNITDNDSIIAPINRGFDRDLLDIGDIKGVEESLKKGDVAAIIIEGIQGIAGIYQPNAPFMLELQALAQRHKALLILDEIQSGYGRSGHFFAHQAIVGLRPDMVTVAKGMGNGFPIGGVIISPRIEAKFGLLGTTFGGNHLACAAALAVLEVINKERLLANAAQVGHYLMRGLKKIKEIKEVRGSGLLIGIEFPYPIKELRSTLLFKHQLFVGSASQPNTIRLLPPLNINISDADACIEKLTAALN